MSADANKALVREYIEAWNRGDLKGMAEYWSPSMRHHTRFQAHGPEAVKLIVAAFMRSFPDLNFHIDDIFAEDDRVVTRMTATGTHTGSYMGVPPSGKRISCNVIGISRVKDGKIVEHWGVTDELHMMQQIGMFPDEYLAAMA